MSRLNGYLQRPVYQYRLFKRDSHTFVISAQTWKKGCVRSISRSARGVERTRVFRAEEIDDFTSLDLPRLMPFPCEPCRTGRRDSVRRRQSGLERGEYFLSFVEVLQIQGEVPAVILCERLTLGWCPILFARLQNDDPAKRNRTCGRKR